MQFFENPVLRKSWGSLKKRVNTYRFGFQGQEKDDEVKGSGNSLDFGARIYDPRLGRWLALDPLQAKYPSLSPYNFVANSPLIFIDPDGREIKGVTYNSETGKFTYKGFAKRNNTEKYLTARMKTTGGTKAVLDLVDSERVFKLVVAEAPLVGEFVTQDGEVKYAVMGGYYENDWIVLGSNENSTQDLIDGGDPEERIIVMKYTESGKPFKTSILRKELMVNDNTEYSQGKEDSGFADWDENNKPKRGSQEDLHNKGAHEEAHAFDDKNESVYGRERDAFSAQKEAAQQYKEQNPTDDD